MAPVHVTIIDPVISHARRQELVSRLSDALVSLDDNLRDQAQWRVIAEAMRADAEPRHGPDRRFATLDAAAWQAHLAGVRPWVPVLDKRHNSSRGTGEAG